MAQATRTVRVIAYAGAAVGFSVGVLAFIASGVAGFAPESLAGPDNPISITFSLVGGFLVARRPRHPVAWALLVAGVGSSFTSVTQAVAYLGTHGHDVPGLRWVYWVNHWCWIFGYVALLQVLFPYFPSGSLPSPRWRWLPWVTAATVVVMLPVTMFSAGRMQDSASAPRNPVGVIPEGVAVTIVNAGPILVSLTVLLLSVVNLVIRTRRARGVERQQLRLLAYAGALVVIGIVLSSDALPRIAVAVSFLCFATPAVAIAFAILRYGLFDIDRVLSRTVAYAIVTGCIVGIYLGMVALTTRALPLSSGVGVAAATLAAAAAFQPLRRRIQGVVDRRFNRARYDADHAIETFAARLRDEVDLPAVNAMLLTEAARHLEPASASLWLAAPSLSVAEG